MLLVPVQAGAGAESALSLDEAREFAFRVLQHRADSRYWDEDYALGGAERVE